MGEVYGDVRNGRAMVNVIVHVSYKMKMDSTRFRKKTSEFYGKKGMSWSGAVVILRGTAVRSSVERTGLRS